MTGLPGLLLLHGAGDDGSCWGPFVRALDLPDLTVATPDAPAHGARRGGPGQSIAWPDLLAAAVAAAEDLVRATSRPAIVGGHSMGAVTALGVAATRPDLVAGLFLEDPPFTEVDDDPEPGTEPQDLTELHAWFTGLQSTTAESLMAAARREHPTWAADEYEPWARSKLAVDASAFAAPVPFVGRGWADLARRTACPVVVAAGEPALDGRVSADAAEFLAGLSGWTVHRLPVGHDVRRDAPGRTAALLRELIRDVI